jgi:hypothetical protein
LSITTRTLPAISNGISKQPPILRSFDQTADEINTWGEIASGVARRAPTEFIAELGVEDLDTIFVHHINRDVTERYVVLIDAGLLKVFDQETGDELAVSAPGGINYLNAPGPSYRAVSVADYTFIINTEVTCLLDEVAVDETPQPDYYVWPGGNQAGRNFYDDFPVAGDPVQYAPNPAAAPSLTGTVQKDTDLPGSPSLGDTYKVAGSSENGFASYYVKWNGSVWDEVVAPGIANAINASTMPHALVRQADGSFVFAPFSWKPRRVGDNTTNPNPPFIGRELRDVFFYKNRLGFLVDESAVFSAAGDYGDFWRRTVLDYIESDPLSVAASTTDVALLDYAVPFNDGMMLFSGQRQFSLSNGESGLSATSVEINPVTGYVMSPGVRPVSIGSQVYFASDLAGYTAVQEYTRLDGSDATDAAEITAHVPGLIPQGVTQLIEAPDLNAIFAVASNVNGGRYVYAYQFFWDRDAKIQSAWRVWDFGENARVVAGTFSAGKLTFVVERAGYYFLERLRLGPGATSANQAHMIYLDRQSTITGTYDAGADETTFLLPYSPNQDAFRIIRGLDAEVPESLIPPASYVWVDAATVSVPGDESGLEVTVGETFRTYLRFSRQFPMDYQSRPVSTGRLQLHTWTVVYTDTAYFTAEISPYGADAVINGGETTYTADFTGRITGSSSLLLGQQVYHSGSFTFTVAGDAAQSVVALSNETPYGSTWVSAEWEGLFFSRALGG